MTKHMPLTCAFALLSVCHGGAGQNLLQNPDFAQWDADAPRPRAWASWAHDLAEGEMTRDQQAVRFTNGAQRHQLFQGAPVTAGEVYEVSCLKKVQLASFYLILAVQWRNAEGRSIEYTMALDGGFDAEFRSLSKTVTAPEGAARAVVIVGPYCIHREGKVADGSIWIRSVTFGAAPKQNAAAAATPGALSNAERATAHRVLSVDRHPAFAGIRKRLALPEADPEQLRSDIHLAHLYPGQAGAPPQAFAVGVATESDKLYTNTRYSGPVDGPVCLALAGGEYGSFQLAVIPFWTDLAAVAVDFGELRAAKDPHVVIPASNCRWFRVGYVTLEKPQPWFGLDYQHSREPDPLLPPAPFAVKSGALAAVWVDVLLPPGTAAGVYRGTVRVSANGQTLSRPLEVESFGFDLPETSTIANEFWLTPSNWRSFYGNHLPYTPDMHVEHAAVLGRYRVSSFPCDWITLCRQVTIYAEEDGRFAFDWSVFDRYVRNALDNGSTAFWSALSCNSGWTRYLHNPKATVIDRATGRKRTLGDYVPALAEGWVPLADMPYRDNRVYRDFLTAYVKHLKELGISGRSYYELFDEPGGDRFLAMLDHHRFFRELVPDLRLLNFGVHPLRNEDGRDALGLIDAWAPHLHVLDRPDALAGMYERRSKHGEELWFYTCVEYRRNPDGTVSHSTRWTPDNYSPFCLYDRPYIAQRIHGWMAWKYQVDGYYIFMLNAVPKVNAARPLAERWPNADWFDGRERGSGTLVYPGPDFQLIPGMRLANIREGLEDYEYLAMLRRLSGQLEQTTHAALLKRIEDALRLEPEIVDSPFTWTKDRATLEAKRRQLAELIRLTARSGRKQPKPGP